MNIVEASHKYEKWLRGHMTLDEEALAKKHIEMARDPFQFFRATFYRWAQLWPEQCEGLDKAPQVLGVGDLHVENFGTWRDEEGRLVWGINDFDEACMMPYTNDLVRLATSAKLAIDLKYLQISFPEACKEILVGYQSTARKYLKEGKDKVHPVVLAERNEWLSQLARQQVRDPDDFWAKFENPQKMRPMAEDGIPPQVRQAMVDLLPSDARVPAGIFWKKRDAGLGSLGRPRFVAMAEWKGGKVAREAKALCPSAWLWAQSKKSQAGKSEHPIHYEDILGQAIRCLDPRVKLIYCTNSDGGRRDCWFVRRLAIDCFKIDLKGVPDKREDDLFRAMGRETAHIHIGAGEEIIKEVRLNLKDELGKRWLEKSATKMAQVMMKEWDEWRKWQQSHR